MKVPWRTIQCGFTLVIWGKSTPFLEGEPTSYRTIGHYGEFGTKNGQKTDTESNQLVSCRRTRRYRLVLSGCEEDCQSSQIKNEVNSDARPFASFRELTWF
jgi:hypothetical protein